MGYVVQASSSWLRGPISTLLMIAVCASGGSAQDPGTPPSGSIQGRVVDSDTGEPIAGAGVALDGTSLRALTDGQGRFTLASVPSGIYTVRVSQVAFEQLVRSDVRVVTGASVDLNLSTSAVVFELGEIVVTPGAFSFMDAGSAGRQTMSRTEIESVPQFGEDIFRAVNRFPGLSGGDYSAQFSIRGGRPDETLIVLDGLEIYEPYHMKDFADGAISILDVETIDGVELLTGGFPVDYGNRLSGVFNVTSRRPAPDSTRYSLGMSLVNARAMAQGTFGDGKGSWFVSRAKGLPRPALQGVEHEGPPHSRVLRCLLHPALRLQPASQPCRSRAPRWRRLRLQHQRHDWDGRHHRHDRVRPEQVRELLCLGDPAVELGRPGGRAQPRIVGAGHG